MVQGKLCVLQEHSLEHGVATLSRTDRGGTEIYMFWRLKQDQKDQETL